MSYETKYLKYKKKYLELKNLKNNLDQFNRETNQSLSAKEFLNQTGGGPCFPFFLSKKCKAHKKQEKERKRQEEERKRQEEERKRQEEERRRQEIQQSVLLSANPLYQSVGQQSVTLSANPLYEPLKGKGIGIKEAKDALRQKEMQDDAQRRYNTPQNRLLRAAPSVPLYRTGVDIYDDTVYLEQKQGEEDSFTYLGNSLISAGASASAAAAGEAVL